MMALSDWSAVALRDLEQDALEASVVPLPPVA
jgi:hypothetical protein